jgi:hypothetical protein
MKLWMFLLNTNIISFSFKLAYDHWGRQLNLISLFMTDKEVNGIVDFPSMAIRNELEQVVSTVFSFAAPRMNCSVATAGSTVQLNYLADAALVRSSDPSTPTFPVISFFC